VQVSEKYTRAGKQLVFELGANDGSWIADFCAKNPDFEPHIFEPQPRFANVLSAIAATYKVHIRLFLRIRYTYASSYV